MSAYPIQSGSDAHAAQRGPVWVPIDQAATLLDRDTGTLRRQCPDLQAQGMARKMLIGGVHKWHIAAAYSPRLIRRAIETDASGASAIQQLLKTTTGAKRERAITDATILRAFRAFKANPDTVVSRDLPGFIEAMTDRHGHCPAKSRLYKMDKDCPSTGDFDGLVAALIDTRGRPRGDIQTCSDAAWSQFCALWLHPNQPPMAKCWRAVREAARANGWSWPSLRRVQQLVAQRLDPSTITLKREGLDAWNRKHLAPMEQDPNAWDAGQCWESDHNYMDIHCRVIRGDGWARTRPHLTAWLDRRTRLLVGWQITEQGNELSIRASLLSALKNPDISAPEIVWLDNGKDFMARSIGGLTKSARRTIAKEQRELDEQASTGLLAMLGITPHFARAYNHNGKARIERFFGTMTREFATDFESYSGNAPGMLDKLDHQATQRDIMALPTLEEVREKFEAFAAWYNCRAEHSIDDLRDPETMERLSPIEFYDRHLPAKRTIKREALTLLEPVWSTPLKVHKTGISLRIGGGTVRYGDMAVELEPLVGSDKRVYISYDPDDMGQVSVWDEQFRFICVAMENRRYGGLATDKIKREDIRAGFAERREQRKRARRKPDVITGSLNTAELSSRASRQREVAETRARMAQHDKTRDPADMPPLRLVRTRLDQAPDDIEDQKMRKAVGAEQFVDPEECGSLIDAARDLHQQEESQFVSGSLLGGFDDIEPTDEQFATGGLTENIDLGVEDDALDTDLRIMDHIR